MASDHEARLDALLLIDTEVDMLQERIARLTALDAAIDQDLAACAEAERCGCPLYVDVRGGEDVTGSARVVHGCGRG